MDKKFEEKRMKRMANESDDMIKKYGWFMHAVMAEDGIHANYHTHGLKENFNHLDLQMTLYIDPNIAHNIFSNMVRIIKNGFKYQKDKRYSQIIEQFEIECKEFEESGRKVLRIILPDENGMFPNEQGCNEIYQTQYDRTME